MIQAVRNAEVQEATPARAGLADYLELSKARLNSLVLLTTSAGFYLASAGEFDFFLLLKTLIGTSLVAGAALAFNQVWERDNDARMERTRERPLPSGRISTGEATFFGVTAGVAGVLYLAFSVNLLTSIIGFLSFAIYLFAYTPLKQRSEWNTVVGAVSGALPPVMGWTALRNELGVEAILLFGLLFFWQHPHFIALAWKYRKDYARGGFRMIGGDNDPARAGLAMVAFSAVLIPVSLGLSLVGLCGGIYLVGSFLAGLIYLGSCIRFLKRGNDRAAMQVFFLSLLYLPTVVVFAMVDKI